MTETTAVSLDTQLSSMSEGDWGDLTLVNTFWDVAFTKSEHDQLVADTNTDPFWGTTGVTSVISAWNSAAYDEVNNTFYFFGGGHNNYGGNEVYSLDLETMEWSRLTDPSPVTFTTTEDGKEIGLPSEGPISPHTYDGLVWNDTTQTMWLTSTSTGFGGGAPSPDQKAVWEFDPATGDWTAHESTSNMQFGSSVYIESTGQTLSLHNENLHEVYASLFDADGTETFLGQVAGLRYATTTFAQPDTGEIYTIAVDEIIRLDVGTSSVTAETVASLPRLSDLNIDFDFGDAGYAYRPVDGKFYIWNGGNEVVTWDPDTNAFDVVWNQGDSEAPGSDVIGADRVFDKWVYLDDEDAFVGIANASDGTFVWKPGSNPDDIDQPEVGAVQVDFQTTGALGVFVPLLAGDKDYDSTAKVWYRAEGSAEWKSAMDLLRIRPEMNKAEQESPEGYAGSIFGLESGKSYEIKVEVSDADGVQGQQVQTITTATKDVPANDPATPTVIDVYDAAGLQVALDNAAPGHVIQVNPGTYTLSEALRLDASGTAENPIVIRGLDRSSTIIDAQDGRGFFIKGDHVTVEDLSITNTSDGITFRYADHITVRGNYIQVNDTDDRGQKAISGRGDDSYIVDNILEGPFDFGRIDTGGADRGINVGGHNVEVAYNTLSGFLDAIAASNNKSVGVEIHHNEILWSTDNGIEMDHGLRNISAHHNRISNTNDALSAQTVAGGPAYLFDNVLLNVGQSPLKVKPLGQEQSQGIYFVNNTIAKEGLAWGNDSGTPSQVFVLNNLFLGQGTNDRGDTLRNLSDHRLLEMDHNAWLTDGRFRMDLADSADISEASFADFQANTPYAEHSLLLAGEQVFENYTLDFDQDGFLVFRDPDGTDFTLDADSSAVDAALVLANINDDYTGAAPDIGAVETGQTAVTYGARITMEPATAPFATADTVFTEVDSAVTFDPAANDSDPNGDAIQVTAITQPANGSAVLNADGTVTYTPPAGYTGDAGFTYTLTDANGEQATGSISLSVTAPNEAPVAGDDSVNAEQDTSVEIAVADLLANDTDANGDPLSVTGVSGGDNGSVSLSGDVVTYTPNSGFLGSDTFTYTLSDGRGGTSTGAVTVDVLSDGIVMGTDGNDTLDLSAATTGQVVEAFAGHDTVTGSAFVDDITGGAGPDDLAGGDGADVFRVAGKSGLDTVAGGGGDDRIVGSAGDDVIGLAAVSGVVAIDSGDGRDVIRGSDGGREEWDFSGVTLTGIDLINAGGHNNLVYGSQGADRIASYGDNDELYGDDGDDVFLYQGASDGFDRIHGDAGTDQILGSDVDDKITLHEFTGLESIDAGAGYDEITGTDAGREEWDFSAMTLTGVEMIDPGGHHDLVTGSAGDDAFRAGAGADSFDGGLGNDVVHFAGNFADYTLTQESGSLVVEALVSDEGRDTLTNMEALQFADGVYRDGSFHAGEVFSSDPEPPAPVASDDSLEVAEDGRIAFDPTANDTVNATTSVSAFTDALHGKVSSDDSGQLVYTPHADYHGADSFSYTLADGDGNTSSATVTVDVTPVNDVPTAQDDTARTMADTPVTVDVLANDSDPDGDSLTVSAVGEPDIGSVTLNDDGSVTYTPDSKGTGVQSFSYTLSDGAGGSDTATVSVDVNPVPPIADADTVAVSEDGSVTFDPLANDLLNPTTVLDRYTSPAHGTVATLDDGRLTYVPDADFNGTDSFDYTLRDGDGNESTATITLNVASVNDAPVATHDSASTNAETAVTIDVLANDSDVDGDPLSVAEVTQPGHGTVAVNDDGTVTYTPDAGVSGVQRFTYTLADGQGGFADGDVAVDVAPAPSLTAVYGTEFRDQIDVSTATGGRAVYALGGNDTVFGSEYADLIDGGTGRDELIAGGGDDTFAVAGDVGIDDLLEGGAGTDIVRGSAGDDVIGARAFVGIEEIDGGAGFDVIRGTDAGREEWDFSATQLTGIELIDAAGHHDLVRGSQGDDRIASSGGRNALYGEGGDDVFLYAGADSDVDVVSGGAGFDRIQGSAGDDEIALDSFDGIEQIDGGDGLDAIRGSDNGREVWDFSGIELLDVELIDAGGHHDRVIGSAGDDHIRGGDGRDRIEGGVGYDTAYFDRDFADYEVTSKDGELRVKAQVGDEGLDRLDNVEALRFADGVYEGGTFTVLGISDSHDQLVYDGA